MWSYWSDCVLIWMMLGENVIPICPRETYMPKRRIAPTKDYIENIIVMQILPLQKTVEENRNKVSLQKPIYHVLKIDICFQNKTYQLSTTLCWTEFEFLPEARFGLRVLSLPACVCVCVCVCGNHELVRVITHHPFKLGHQIWTTGTKQLG